MTESQRMTELMNGNVLQTRTAMLNRAIVQLPVFVDVKMCIAAASRAGIEGVCQDVARPVKIISISVVFPFERTRIYYF